MLNTAAFLRGVFACIVTLCSIAYALAGDVKLVSDTLDSVCRIHITWGPNAPDGTPVEHYSDAEKLVDNQAGQALLSPRKYSRQL